MRFAYQNYADYNEYGYTLTSSDVYSSVYPVSNLYHSHLSKIWKSAAITNLITDGDCESSSTPTLDVSYDDLTNGTWARSDVQKQAGTYSWVLTKTTASGAGDAEVSLVDTVSTTDMHGLEVGRTYKLSAYIFTDAVTLGNADIIFQEYYAAAWNDSITLNATVVSTWQNKTGVVTINSLTTGVRIKLVIASAEDVNKVLYIDELKFYLENRLFLDVGSGVTITPTTCAIAGHNLSSNAVIKIQGNASLSWENPTVNETMTYNSENILKFITGSALRYWSLVIEDWDNTDGYIEIGYFYLGLYLGLTIGAAINFPKNIEENSKKRRSPTGQVFGNQYGTKLIGYDLNFAWITNTELSNLELMYDEVRNYKPFFAIIDENNLTGIKPLYCTLDDFGFNHIKGLNWSAKMRLMEAK